MRSECPLDKCSNSESGFTLLEMLVALAILALALSVLFGMLSDGTRRTGEAEALADAGLHARSLLAKVGSEIPLQGGVTDGQLDNGFRWQVRVEPYGGAADRREWPVAAYTVAAEVVWTDGVRERSAVLTTLRLGPRGPLR